MMPRRPATAVAAAACLAAAALAGCTSSGSASAAGVAVQASRDACTVSPATAAPGSVTVTATWAGEGPGEVYLYGKDGDAFTAVAGEAEDLTDGLTKSFTAEVAAGDYEIACKVADVDRRTPFRVG